MYGITFYYSLLQGTGTGIMLLLLLLLLFSCSLLRASECASACFAIRNNESLKTHETVSTKDFYS